MTVGFLQTKKSGLPEFGEVLKSLVATGLFNKLCLVCKILRIST